MRAALDRALTPMRQPSPCRPVPFHTTREPPNPASRQPRFPWPNTSAHTTRHDDATEPAPTRAGTRWCSLCCVVFVTKVTLVDRSRCQQSATDTNHTSDTRNLFLRYDQCVAPKTIPKQWTAIPGTFGKAATIDWRSPNLDSPERTRHRHADQLAAAQMQHDWAWQLTAWRRTRKLGVRELAALLDMTEQRMGDLLRGDTPATLLDIAAGQRLGGR